MKSGLRTENLESIATIKQELALNSAKRAELTAKAEKLSSLLNTYSKKVQDVGQSKEAKTLFSRLEVAATATVEWSKNAPENTVDAAIARVESFKLVVIDAKQQIQTTKEDVKAAVTESTQKVKKGFNFQLQSFKAQVGLVKEQAALKNQGLVDLKNRATNLYQSVVKQRVADVAKQIVTKGEFRADLSKVKPNVSYVVGDYRVKKEIAKRGADKGNVNYKLTNKRGAVLLSFKLDDKGRAVSITQKKPFDHVGFKAQAKGLLNDRNVVATTDKKFEIAHAKASEQILAAAEGQINRQAKSENLSLESERGIKIEGNSFNYEMKNQVITISDKITGKVVLVSDKNGVRSNIPPDKVDKIEKSAARIEKGAVTKSKSKSKGVEIAR